MTNSTIKLESQKENPVPIVIRSMRVFENEEACYKKFNIRGLIYPITRLLNWINSFASNWKAVMFDNFSPAPTVLSDKIYVFDITKGKFKIAEELPKNVSLMISSTTKVNDRTS